MCALAHPCRRLKAPPIQEFTTGALSVHCSSIQKPKSGKECGKCGKSRKFRKSSVCLVCGRPKKVLTALPLHLFSMPTQVSEGESLCVSAYVSAREIPGVCVCMCHCAHAMSLDQKTKLRKRYSVLTSCSSVRVGIDAVFVVRAQECIYVCALFNLF